MYPVFHVDNSFFEKVDSSNFGGSMIKIAVIYGKFQMTHPFYCLVCVSYTIKADVTILQMQPIFFTHFSGIHVSLYYFAPTSVCLVTKACKILFVCQIIHGKIRVIEFTIEKCGIGFTFLSAFTTHETVIVFL